MKPNNAFSFPKYQRGFDGMSMQMQSLANIKHTPLFTSPLGGSLQRKCSDCHKTRQLLEHRAVSQSWPATVPPIVHEVLREPGEPLDMMTRAFMEPRFGHDFSGVRVHTDTKAADSARAVNALAYTVGRDVVFEASEFRPGTDRGKRLLGHELAHVVQQGTMAGYQQGTLQISMSDDALEYQAKEVAQEIGGTRFVNFTNTSRGPLLQRDLARPPHGTPAPVRVLTPQEVDEAFAFNQRRFRDPYSISVIRDIMGGMNEVPAIVDNEFVQQVVQWQAERHMVQNGKIGHSVTRSFFSELVAEGQYRDAVILLIDSYALPGSPRLDDIRVGPGDNCCGTPGTETADSIAITSGGMGSGSPVRICVCQREVRRAVADYNSFVRTIGHELVHVRQRAANNVSYSQVRELEAYFWEVCSEGRAPALTPADRETFAIVALTKLQEIGIPPNCVITPGQRSMLTIEQNGMRLQLINLVSIRHGLPPCPLPAQTPHCRPPAVQTP